MIHMNYAVKCASDRLKLKYDRRSGIAYGVIESYSVLLRTSEINGEPVFEVLMCVKNPGDEHPGSLLYGTNTPVLRDVLKKGYRITFTLDPQQNEKWCADALDRLVSTLVFKMYENGYVSCDEYGVSGKTGIYRSGDRFMFVNDISYERFIKEAKNKKDIFPYLKERYISGTFAAVFAAAAGAVLMVFLLPFGKTAVLSGILTGMAVFFLYRKFGVRFSSVSLFITAVISVVYSYAAYRLSDSADPVSVMICGAGMSVPVLIILYISEILKYRIVRIT